MRKIILVIAAVFFFAGSANAAEFKIAFVNVSQIALTCDAFKSEQSRIQNAFKSESKTLETANTALEKRYNDFRSRQAGLTPEARETQQLELIRQKRDFDDKAAAFRRKVSAEENKASEKITTVILVASEIYGKRNSITVLMDSNTSGAIFLDTSLDVTQELLKETNKVWKEQPKALKDALARNQASLTN